MPSSPLLARKDSVRFAPSLVFGKETGKETKFSLAIDDARVRATAPLVTGVLQKEETAGGMVLRLMPKEPEWAIERVVKTEIRVNGGEILIRTTVGEI